MGDSLPTAKEGYKILKRGTVPTAEPPPPEEESWPMATCWRCGAMFRHASDKVFWTTYINGDIQAVLCPEEGCHKIIYVGMLC